VFRGNQQIALEAWRDPDTMATTGRIIQTIRNYNVPHDNVNVDADGLGGPIVDRLREQGFHFRAVHNGGEPLDKERFVNLSAELWASAAQKIERGEVALLNDPKLIAQLASRRAKPRSDGRVQLESKEEMRRRGLPSPDRADAVVLALAGNIRRAEVGVFRVENPEREKERADREWVKEHLRRAQAEADRIRAEREAKGVTA
jgi:phage terminase large subunit